MRTRIVARVKLKTNLMMLGIARNFLALTTIHSSLLDLKYLEVMYVHYATFMIKSSRNGKQVPQKSACAMLENYPDSKTTHQLPTSHGSKKTVEILSILTEVEVLIVRLHSQLKTQTHPYPSLHVKMKRKEAYLVQIQLALITLRLQRAQK